MISNQKNRRANLMQGSSTKSTRIDTERELYRPEVFENQKHNIYGTPVYQKPLSLIWLVLAFSAIAAIYYLFLTTNYTPILSAIVTEISDSGEIVIEARIDIDDLRRKMPSKNLKIYFGSTLEQDVELPTASMSLRSCAEPSKCSHIVLASGPKFLVEALDRDPILSILLRPEKLYKTII